MYRPLAVYHQLSIRSLNYCSLVGFKGKGSYSPFPGLSCLFNHQQLFIEKVAEAPDPLFSGLDEKWIQAYISWEGNSQILLAWRHFLLVLVNDYFKGWLASDSCPLGKQENLLVPDYWTGLFSSPVIVGNLWDHELVYMSLVNDSPGLLTVAGCWWKSPPTWLVSAGYSAWHFFTDGVF